MFGKNDFKSVDVLHMGTIRSFDLPVVHSLFDPQLYLALDLQDMEEIDH